MIEGTEFLVKQCPCFREFEGEHLCVNDNYVKKIITIDVDTELIGSKHVSEEFINSKTNDDDLCFCLAYLGGDELYYCMSQQRNIKVRGQQGGDATSLGNSVSRECEILISTLWRMSV